MKTHQSQRLRWGLLAAVLSSTALVPFALADTSTPLPTTGCAGTFTDAEGDANKQLDFGQGSAANVPSDPDVDLTAVTFASPPGKIRAYLKVKDLGKPTNGVGDIFAARFIFKGKPVDVFAGRDHPSALEAAHGVPTMLKLKGVLYDGVNVATPDVAYDETNNLVILTADRAPLEAAASGSLADGTTISATSATTGYDLFTTTQTADSAQPATPAAATYTMGDNSCFVAATPSPTPTPTGTPNPTTPPPVTANLFDQPRVGCNAFTDATEDAKPSPLGNETDLDVDRVNFKTTSEALSVFVHVVSLKAAPALPFDGHRFTVAFTTAGKAIALSAQAAGPATATVGGTANTALKPTAVFDTTKSNVVITVPLAELATVTGVPATGSTVTATTITTAALVKTASREFAADTATGTAEAEKTHTIGDNRCFLPPPGFLTLDTDPSGQHSDKTSFVATLTDADELAVEGATITLGFKGTALRTLVTDEDGMVELAAPITMNAGAATLTASFAGDNAVGPAAASKPFTVVLEKSVLTAKGSAGAVTAVLLDDDKTPLADHTVVFTVGKKVTSVKTDTKGIARLSRLARGTAVTVDYKGISGRYAAAKRVSAKAT